MPSPLTAMITDLPHTNSRGTSFAISLSKKALTPEHNYWLYFIVATHKEWGNQSFSLLVTKQTFPIESVADHLATTLAIEETRARLEEADESGRPLRVPFFKEGWALM